MIPAVKLKRREIFKMICLNLIIQMWFFLTYVYCKDRFQKETVKTLYKTCWKKGAAITLGVRNVSTTDNDKLTCNYFWTIED